MCELLKGGPSLLPGWGCCECRSYNGLQRMVCKMECRTPGRQRCTSLEREIDEAVLGPELRTCPDCGAGYRPEHLPGGSAQIVNTLCLCCGADSDRIGGGQGPAGVKQAGEES